MELGYALSSEEHGPADLIENARRAEAAGFSFALISDHLHPWIDRQGESPFVWPVIGAIAQLTEGGSAKPRYGQLTVCWAESEQAARQTAHEWWPNAALGGDLSQELPLPRHFEQAAATVTEDDVAASVVCDPDAGRIRSAIEEFEQAGFDRVYLHQVGPDQAAFLRFCERELLSALAVA